MIVDQEEKLEQLAATLGDTFLIQEVFNAFINTYPKDWKKLKVTYGKFKRSKKFGNSIPLPRPEEGLRKTISVWMHTRKKKQ